MGQNKWPEQGATCKALYFFASTALPSVSQAAASLRLQRPAEALEDARRSRHLDPACVKVRPALLGSLVSTYWAPRCDSHGILGLLVRYAALFKAVSCQLGPYWELSMASYTHSRA